MSQEVIKALIAQLEMSKAVEYHCVQESRARMEQFAQFLNPSTKALSYQHIREHLNSIESINEEIDKLKEQIL